MTYNAGEVPFDKELTEIQKSEVLACFGERKSSRQLMIMPQNNESEKKSVLIFEEYYGDIEMDLQDLAQWCKENGIHIADGAVISVYSDDGGSYVYSASKAGFECFNAAETTIRNADTADLLAELERRITGSAIEILVNGTTYRLPMDVAEAAHERVKKTRLCKKALDALARTKMVDLDQLNDEEKQALAERIAEEYTLYCFDPSILSENDIMEMAARSVLSQEEVEEE